MSANAERRGPRPLPEDLEEVFREHSAMVLRTAHRLTGSMEDAEDALQTLFLRLLAQERPLDLSANAKGYLHRAAVNLALDAIRARKRRAAPIDAPAPRSDNQALQDSVRVALGRLKPKAAEIFALRYLEGYSNGEIATMIGTSPSVIAVTLFRTRIRLKRMIRYQLRGKWGSS